MKATRQGKVWPTAALSLGQMMFASIIAAVAVVVPASAQEPLAVVTTTSDLRSLVEAVGGSRVSVTNLVPPKLDAEVYQPRPRDLARVKTARLAVRVGLDFDLWFDRLLMQAGEGVRRGGPGYVDASYAIAALEVRGLAVGPGDGHAHGSGNPHYWLDPKNADIITGNILAALGRVDPEHAAVYEANRARFLAHLQDKLAGWQAKLATLRSVPLVAYHDSWAYFARRFGLDFIGYIEPKPGVPASPGQLAALIAAMQARGARVIVRQPHEPEKDVAFVAKRAGSAVAVLGGSVDALPDTSDYMSLFDYDVTALVRAAKP